MFDVTVILMLGASIFLGVMSLAAFYWASKNHQFDDEQKATHMVMFDSEEDLNDMVKREEKKKGYKEKKETP